MQESFKIPSATFPTLTGSIVTFNSQYAGLPLKSHKIALTATQSGSGTPSPDNVRPITGYSAINISHSDPDTSNPTVYTIQIGSTVYGSEYDARTGVLTVTHGFETYDGSADETWDSFNIDLRMGVRGRTTANKSYVDSNISNIFDNSISNVTYADEANSYTWRSSPYVSNLVFFYVPLSENITSVEQWRTWLSNHPTTICYKLATPQTIQLPPCPIDVLEGQNNIWADTGETTLSYISI